jgi:hypothetical protein
MCSWPNGKRSASDQLIGGLNTMVHNGSCDRESCSGATVAARPLILTARGSAPVECPNRAETHLDQLLRDVDACDASATRLPVVWHSRPRSRASSMSCMHRLGSSKHRP